METPAIGQLFSPTTRNRPFYPPQIHTIPRQYRPATELSGRQASGKVRPRVTILIDDVRRRILPARAVIRLVLRSRLRLREQRLRAPGQDHAPHQPPRDHEHPSGGAMDGCRMLACSSVDHRRTLARSTPLSASEPPSLVRETDPEGVQHHQPQNDNRPLVGGAAVESREKSSDSAPLLRPRPPKVRTTNQPMSFFPFLAPGPPQNRVHGTTSGFVTV